MTLTPAGIPVRETKRALAAVRVPMERRALAIISGANAGQVFYLHAEHHVLGRGDVADLRVDDADISRIHAHFRRRPDGQYVVEDASSTNGTFLGSEKIERATLKPGDRLQCGTCLVLRYSVTDDIEQELHERMLASSSRDVLTRVYNRTHLIERLDAELAHLRRHESPLTLLMIDVDGLRRVNEAYGLEAGDVLLRAIAGRLNRLIRVEDVLARVGGDEFAILARSTTLASAAALAERLRLAVREIQLPPVSREGDSIGATLSIGIAAASELSLSSGSAELIAAANARLGDAKTAGGDRVAAG